VFSTACQVPATLLQVAPPLPLLQLVPLSQEHPGPLAQVAVPSGRTRPPVAPVNPPGQAWLQAPHGLVGLQIDAPRSTVVTGARSRYGLLPVPRIKLEELARYPARVELAVRGCDLNYGAHLAHDRLLTLAHEARLELLAQLGFTSDVGVAGDVSLMVSDAVISYRGEAFRGERLTFEMSAGEIGGSTFRLHYRVRKQGEAPVALLEVGLAAVSHRSRRPTRLPAALRDALVRLEAAAAPAERPA
jgi:acyl-CoA thioesterase FadM